MPVGQARLLSPVSIEEQDAIRALADYSVRLGGSFPRSLRIEKSCAKKDGIIKYDLSNPGDWSEVVLKGIQIGLANPMFKPPNANNNDAFGLDLVLCRSMLRRRPNIEEQPMFPATKPLKISGLIVDPVSGDDTRSFTGWRGDVNRP